MKERFMNTLKHFAGGPTSNVNYGKAATAIVLALCTLLSLPLVPLLALKWMGFGLTLTLKSYLGSATLLVFYLLLRGIGGSKS